MKLKSIIIIIYYSVNKQDIFFTKIQQLEIMILNSIKIVTYKKM